PKGALRSGPYGAYTASFDLVLVPSKPIIGTVRDRRTGKPLPGATVVCSSGGYARATTDAKGRYRLDGGPKVRAYWGSAGGPPHFNGTNLELADTPGLDPLTGDFALDRGVLVRGGLTARATGKPIAGWVGYRPDSDNPNVKDYPDLGKPQVIAFSHGDVGAD